MPPTPKHPLYQLMHDAGRVAHSAAMVGSHLAGQQRDILINRTSKLMRDNAPQQHNMPDIGSAFSSMVRTAMDIPTAMSNSMQQAGQQPQMHNNFSQQQTQPFRSQSRYTQPQRQQQQQTSSYQQHNDEDDSIDIPIHSSDVETAVTSQASSIRTKATNVVQNLRAVADIAQPTKLTRPVEENYQAVAKSEAKKAINETAEQSTEPQSPQEDNPISTAVNGAMRGAAQVTQAATDTNPQHHQESQLNPARNEYQRPQSQPFQKQQQPPTHQHSPPPPRQSASHPPPTASSLPQPKPVPPAQAKQQFSNNQAAQSETIRAAMPKEWKPREVAVPSSQFGRVWGFGRMAAGMIAGSVTDRFTGGEQSAPNQLSPAGAGSTGGSLSGVLSSNNAERLAEGLCRMRGAALKVGQILSIQDESVLPPQLQAIFDRVRDRADVMPRRQLDHALQTELGDDWRDKVDEFDFQPIAAASIGQVHRATTLDTKTPIVMKVQYPGVADSINSDINNVKRMITWLNIVPKGFYLEDTMQSAKEELGLECDYLYEAKCQKQYRQMMEPYQDRFYVPAVIDELSSKRVISSEMVTGIAVDRLAVGASHEQPQEDRNRIAYNLVELCIVELFVHRFMQTDPNWSNFLYNPQTQIINLIDFGASRTYDKLFVDEYMRMVKACASRDREAVIDSSIRMGFLTGDESKTMMDAHVEAGFIIGEPFASHEPYDFVAANIPARVSKLAGVMLKLRLTPPPKEAYTLHRKLSGAFLTARKLHAKIECKSAFDRIYDNYQFETTRYDAKTMKAKIAKLHR